MKKPVQDPLRLGRSVLLWSKNTLLLIDTVVLPIPITLSAVVKPRGGHGPRVGTCWEPMVPGPRETVGSSALSVKGAGKPRVKP